MGKEKDNDDIFLYFFFVFPLWMWWAGEKSNSRRPKKNWPFPR
jgi:hypothetical protein